MMMCTRAFASAHHLLYMPNGTFHSVNELSRKESVIPEVLLETWLRSSGFTFFKLSSVTTDPATTFWFALIFHNIIFHECLGHLYFRCLI